MPHDFHCARPDPGRKTPVPPFAALPHHIAADPRLSPTDVRVLLALLYWARASDSCWASDPSIAERIGRCVGTVQRSLRKLCGLGLVERRKADDNPTGRRIVLLWRRRSTPPSPALDPPASSARDEWKNQREKERPIGPGMGNPSRPAGDGEAIGVEDLAMFEAWSRGSDPTLRRLGLAALATAGVVAPVEVESPGVSPVVENSSRSQQPSQGVVEMPPAPRMPSAPGEAGASRREVPTSIATGDDLKAVGVTSESEMISVLKVAGPRRPALGPPPVEVGITPRARSG